MPAEPDHNWLQLGHRCWKGAGTVDVASINFGALLGTGTDRTIEQEMRCLEMLHGVRTQPSSTWTRFVPDDDERTLQLRVRRAVHIPLFVVATVLHMPSNRP